MKGKKWYKNNLEQKRDMAGINQKSFQTKLTQGAEMKGNQKLKLTQQRLKARPKIIIIPLLLVFC